MKKKFEIPNDTFSQSIPVFGMVSSGGTYPY